MRYRGLMLLVGAAGCSSGLLEATRKTPSGFPVTVTTTTLTGGIVPTSGTISGQGDSVVATVTRPATCGRTLSADAGNGSSSSDLVVTISLTSEGVQNCMPINAMTSYRAVVRGLAAGTFNVSAHVRLVSNGAISDTTVVEKAVTLP